MGKINDFGFPFTSITGDRQYSASEWRDYFGKLIKNGVIQNDGNVVAVVQQASANKTVSVGTGSVFINGVMFINDSAKTLSITDNTSGNPRKDRIVARLSYTDRKIEFGVLVGTPAGSPVAPTLTRNTTVYELGIADITLANGFSTIVTANILDTRSDVDLCGASSMTIGVIPASGADAETIILNPATQALYSTVNVDETFVELFDKFVPNNGTNLVADGYAKLGALIIQWGTGSVNNSSGVTNTFPIAFPNACLTVAPTPLSNNYVCRATTLTATTFLGLGSGNITIRYIAIGY